MGESSKPIAERNMHPPWPAPGEHLFTPWTLNTGVGMQRGSYYRVCRHPDCTIFETKNA